jgi:hypothetical protein
MGVLLTFIIMAGTPTDWEVARETVTEMFTDIEGVEDIESVVLYDARYSSDDAGYLVRTQLAEVLKERGIEVYLASPLGAEPEVELRYLVNQLRVVHKRSYRKLLLGRKMIERWAQAEVEITLMKDNMVISQQRFVNENKSVFPESELDLVRSQSLTQEYYTSSSAGSLWEPIIVTAMVGTLIYIFYAPSNQ